MTAAQIPAKTVGFSDDPARSTTHKTIYAPPQPAPNPLDGEKLLPKPLDFHRSIEGEAAS